MPSPYQREQWASRAGFILATIGCAVGLGNIWRFSYAAGQNGGAAFLLVYIACVLILGLPLMLAEFAMGRRAQADVVAAYRSPGVSAGWALAGWLGVLTALLILSYYAVIAGWAYKYFFSYLSGALSEVSAPGAAVRFERFIAHPFEPVLWQLLVLLTCVGVVLGGVKRGIESANKVMMPLLAAIVLMLAGYSLSLPGGRAGLAFLFDPDWSVLRQPAVYVAALGQAFFSLGIGLGALITYGSYAAGHERLAPAAMLIAAGDTLFAVVAGIAIFPAVFAFGLDPAQGPTLAFVTLPEVFAVMPGGQLFGAAFFFLLSIAALTSAVSLVEVPVAVIMRWRGWSRQISALVVGLAAFAAGIPSALGFGVLGHVLLFGAGILETVDHLASNVMLPMGGLLVAVFTGWTLSRAEALDAAGLQFTRLGRAWIQLLRFGVPCLIALILATLVL